METRTICPACGSPSIQGQLVPKGSLAAGVLTGILTDDAAASLMASQMGGTVVKAFCLECGAQWLPGTDGEHQLRAMSGQLGVDAQAKALQPPEHHMERFNCPGCGAGRSYKGSREIRGKRYCEGCAASRV